MDIKKYALNFVIVFGLLATTSWADTYTGSIKYSDGLIGTAVWSSAELTWTVDNETNPGFWTYAYTFTVDAKDISYVINGVWENFTSESIKNGTTGSCELGSFGHQGTSAPGIPEDIYGMKCTPSDDSLTYSWSIVTNREPMWDDFYAQSGKHKGNWVYAYNTGFGTDPPDSLIADGNNGGWVLVPGMTYNEKTVHDFAINRFIKIRNVIAPEDETEPKAEFIGQIIEVASEKWVYILDSAGYQVFKPKATFPHIESTFSTDISQILDRWLEQPADPSKIDEAKLLAMATIGANYMDVAVEVIPARELIASRRLYTDTPRHHVGRTIVMFRPIRGEDLMVTRYYTYLWQNPDGSWRVITKPTELPQSSYETAISFFGDRVLRVESEFLAPDDLEVVKGFREGLANRLIIGRPYLVDPRLRLGTFFSPDEWRFEATAYSFEGENFVHKRNDVYFLGFPVDCDDKANCRDICNPYDQVNIPYCGWNDPTVDFDYFRTTEAYRYDFWVNWCDTLQSNGIRGNCEYYNESTDTCYDWQYPNMRVFHHKDLGSYFLSCNAPGSEPPKCRLPYAYFEHCDGAYILLHPHGVAYKLEQRFYDDLEECHVAMISTHGGMADCSDFFQFGKQYHLWVSLHREGDDKFGINNLRHLFFAGCSSMNWIHGPKHGEPQNLFHDWMSPHFADGIRTMCGADGGSFGAHITGLHFFNHYNRRKESISQAWLNTEYTKSTSNVPVTVAWDSTLDKAASTLFDGRFTRERAGTGWAIASVLISPHLTHHQACCLPYTDPDTNTRCIDVADYECEAMGGYPKGSGTNCHRWCPTYEQLVLCPIIPKKAE